MGRVFKISVMFLIVVATVVSAQEQTDILRAFQKNFVRGNLNTKIQVLQDAATRSDIDMGPLYHQALQFVIANASIFESDLVARELGILAVRLIGMSGYNDALYSLWEYFTADDERSIRIAVLNGIGSLAPVDSRLVNNLNRWLSGENDKLRAEEDVDLEVVEEAVVALGKIGDDSSFPVLFSVSILGGSDEIDEKAIEALYSIEGDFQDLILRVIEQNPLAEKLEALRIGLSNEDLKDNEKGTIAESALSKGLYTTASQSQEREILRQIRYESIRTLTNYSWSTATKDVIEHFDQTLQETILGIGRTSHVLEAIQALGAMNTHEAAVRLSLYLDLLNSDVERGKNVEDEIVLAVIKNLGELGDKVAFDYLLYARLLSYSDSIKKAAQESLNQLNRL
jgi:hypothetical protein